MVTTATFLPREHYGQRSLLGTVSRVAKSRTRLKQLSASMINYVVQVFCIHDFLSAFSNSYRKKYVKKNAKLTVSLFVSASSLHFCHIHYEAMLLSAYRFEVVIYFL